MLDSVANHSRSVAHLAASGGGQVGFVMVVPMNKRTISIIATIGAIGIAATVGITAAAAASTNGDDTELPITGTALTRASEAALDHTGQGRVTDTEVGDEESYYEVEVTLDNGREVDVQLDEAFQVVSAAEDTEREAGDD